MKVFRRCRHFSFPYEFKGPEDTPKLLKDAHPSCFYPWKRDCIEPQPDCASLDNNSKSSLKQAKRPEPLKPTWKLAVPGMTVRDYKTTAVKAGINLLQRYALPLSFLEEAHVASIKANLL